MGSGIVGYGVGCIGNGVGIGVWCGYWCMVGVVGVMLYGGGCGIVMYAVGYVDSEVSCGLVVYGGSCSVWCRFWCMVRVVTAHISVWCSLWE